MLAVYCIQSIAEEIVKPNISSSNEESQEMTELLARKTNDWSGVQQSGSR